MTRERTVWIVGDPEESLPKTDPRYHAADCYVLEQQPNLDRAKRVPLSSLPPAYGPCQICAPGDRAAAGSLSRSEIEGSPDQPPGISVGDAVHIEDLSDGSTRIVRVVTPGTSLQQGLVSSTSPVGAALIGRTTGEVVTINLPRGAARRVRIVQVSPAAER